MQNGAEIVKAEDVTTGQIVKHNLEGQSIEVRGTAAIAMAEKERAIVQARIMQAVARPRDIMVVRERILKDCQRPGFAKTAMYAKPMGKKGGVQQFVTGMSIRYAESAARHFGNIDVTQVVIHDDPRVRILKVTAIDLETNGSLSVEVIAEKTIERKSTKEGQVVLATRLNAYNERVYIIEATEDEFLVKQNANVAKARRQVILALIPGDLTDEAKERIAKTEAAAEAGIDPTQKLKNFVDKFAAIGISAAQLNEYLGHSIEQATREEFEELVLVSKGINAKEATWSECLAAKKDGETIDEATGEVKESAATSALKDKLKKTAEKKAPAAPATTVAAAATTPAKSTEPDETFTFDSKDVAIVGGKLLTVADKDELRKLEGLLAKYADEATPDELAELNTRVDAARSRIANK